MRTLAIWSVLTGFSLTAMMAILTTSSSSNSSFGMINQLQMIIVLPLIGSYIPDEVMDFVKAMSESLFSFEFLPTEETFFITRIEEKYYFPQKNVYLFLLDLKSGSSIVTVANLLIVIFFAICAHISILAIYLIFKNLLKLNWISKQLRKVLSSLTFGIYITFFLETYLLVIIIVMNEVSENDNGSAQRNDSLKIAYVLLTFMILFNIFVIYQWIKSFWPNEFARIKYSKTLFKELKYNKWSRAFPVLFLLRRGFF
jgi:hypothetical protein